MAENQKLVPVLRFKDEQGSDYPDWEGKLLGEISRFSKGKGISKTDVKENGTVKCIRYGELYTRYGETISNVISSTNVPVSELVLSHKNDVIIPASGETALDIASAACITAEGVALGGDINIIRCQQNGIFLAYYLISKKKDIARLAQGISIVHLYSAQLTSLNLRIPSKQEQQKIAAFLSSVDTKIEQLGKKKALVEQYKKGMMQKLFNQEIRFKDEQGKDYPDWEEVRAAQIFTSHTNKKHNSDLPILAATQDRGVIPRNETGLEIQSSARSIASYKVIEPGDFVISLRSFQGGIEYSEYHGIGSPAYTVLKPIVEIISDFFRFYFKKKNFISRLCNTIIGIRDGKQIPYGDFAAMKLCVPSLKEQQKIAAFLSSIDKKIELVTEQLKQARTFKKGLLQQMFI